MKHKSTFIFLIAVLMTLSSTMKAKVTNPYLIDDDCYKIYCESRKYRNSPKCLDYYKKMLSLANEIGDDRAVCQAMCIPLQYYRYNGTEKQFFASLEALREKAKSVDADNYYYWCLEEEILFYIDTNRSFKALNKVNEIRKSLEERPSAYGNYACYTAFGYVYIARHDELHARENLLKAVSISKDINNYFDLPAVYLSLARITEASDTILRNKYLTEALRNSINPTDSASALMGLAYLRSNQNHIREFMNLYRTYKPILYREGIASARYEKWYKSNEAFRMSLENKLDSANIIRQSINDPYLRYQAQADYADAIGDYKTANMYLDSIVTFLRSAQSAQNISDVAEINAVYETDQLRYQTKIMQEQFNKNMLIAITAALLIVAITLFFWLQRHKAMTKRLHVLTDELTVARDEAIQASKMKDEFVQNMSHEIRTPLNAVSGFAQLLALPSEMFSDDERREFGEHIQNNTSLLTMLIDDILNISDVESGNYKMEISQYKVNEICTVALSTIRYRIRAGIDLKFTTEVDDDYTIQTDARRVQQVLINYLTNSIKHTEKGSIHLHVSLSENPGMITFSVSDTGCGIPKDKAEEVFQRFKKLNAFKQGTGLGLNICRIIAEKLNGTCALDTTYTDGARFIFTLPL